jgi:hypothetical protein
VFWSLQQHYRYSDIQLVDTHAQVQAGLTGRTVPIHEETVQCLACAHRLHAEHGGLPPLLSVVVLSLRAWSTQTRAEFCKDEGKGWHYPISHPGVLVNCLKNNS